MRINPARFPAAIRATVAIVMVVLWTCAAAADAVPQPGAAAGAAEGATPAPGTAPGVKRPIQGDAGTLPPKEEIEKHERYQAGPTLQETPGGGLVVNAFIMNGPVRVEVRDRDSGKVLMEKQKDVLFPFEIPREELGVAPARAVVRIYVQGQLIHELNLVPGD